MDEGKLIKWLEKRIKEWSKLFKQVYKKHRETSSITNEVKVTVEIYKEVLDFVKKKHK